MSALNSSANTICLAPGTHNVADTIFVPAGKTLRGQSNNSTDSQVISTTSVTVQPASGATVSYLTIRGASGTLPTFGVIAYDVQNSSASPIRLHHLAISGNLINLAIVNSSNVTVSDTTMSNPGNPTSHSSDPNVWITNSSAIKLQAVTAYGGGDPGFDSTGALSGDGEIAVYDSSAVELDGVTSIDSMTSAIYFRRCVNCVIRNSTVTRARGWGLDMVDSGPPSVPYTLGNDNLLVEKTTVSNSGAAASILYLINNITVTYRDNTFIDNNQPVNPNGTDYNGVPPAGRCSGIDVRMSSGTLVTARNKVYIAGVLQPSQERCTSALS